MQDRPVDPRGNLNEKQLEEALLLEDFFPPFVFSFFKKYEKMSDRIKFFSMLLSQFFDEKIQKEKGFLSKYFRLEKEIRLILTALRAKEIKRDISYELQYEDATDFFVAYILAQKDMDTFEPPKEYEELKILYKKYHQTPLLLMKENIFFRLKKIEQMQEGKEFSIDYILSYQAILAMVEDWMQLEIEKEKKIIETLV